MRTGVRNTPLTRDEARALFMPEETFSQDVVGLVMREDTRCRERDLMQDDGPSLHLGIIPEERYERDREPFDRGKGMLKGAPLFHGGRSVFNGCQDGHEALEVTFDRGRSITRLFIGNDWSIYLQVARRFRDDHGRVTTHEFGEALPKYMRALSERLEREGLDGPSCLSLGVANLRGGGKVGWVFPHADALSVRPTLVDRIDDPDLLGWFHRVLRDGSRYG